MKAEISARMSHTIDWDAQIEAFASERGLPWQPTDPTFQTLCANTVLCKPIRALGSVTKAIADRIAEHTNLFTRFPETMKVGNLLTGLAVSL